MAVLDEFTWLPFQNKHATLTVPPHGVMEVTGTATVNGQQLLTITQPSTTFQRFYYVNGPTSVVPGAISRCTFGPNCIVRYDSAATPAFGESWGAKPSSWDLFPDRPGFEVLGTIPNNFPATLNIIHAIQQVVNVLKCAPVSNIAAPGSGAATIKMGPTGVTGGFANITLVNDYISNGEIITAGKNVIARYFADEQEWHQVERECE